MRSYIVTCSRAFVVAGFAVDFVVVVFVVFFLEGGGRNRATSGINKKGAGQLVEQTRLRPLPTAPDIGESRSWKAVY
jgi:hypothetical protein